jgi:hypothetical protein
MRWYVAEAALPGLILEDADPGCLIGCLVEVAPKQLDLDAGTYADELGVPRKCRFQCRLRFGVPFRSAQVSTVHRPSVSPSALFAFRTYLDF